MKRIVTILMLAVAIIVGCGSVDAKTTKKSGSKTSSSIKFSEMYDGYPDIGGHTYSGSIQGLKVTLKFEPLQPGSPNGFYTIRASYRGQWEEEINNWYYEGDGDIMVYMDGGTPVYFQIRNGGKELYNEDANYTLKATK